LVEEDVPAQRAVLFKSNPSSAARRIAIVVAVPGELRERPSVSLPVTAVHPPLDRDEAEASRALAIEAEERGPK
jgi:hypothetical protein